MTNNENPLSYACGRADTPLVYDTIGSLLDTTVASYPDEPALVVTHQDIRWSWSELGREVDRLSAGLLALGLKPGDRLGIWGPNSYEWVLTQLATAKIGVILVCINPAYRAFEVEYALNKVECRALVCAESFKETHYLEILADLAPELTQATPGALSSSRLPHLETVIRLGESSSPGMYRFSDICALGTDTHYAQVSAISADLSPDDPINIQFTSGTTGNPKGATLTHFNILNNGLANAQAMELTHKDSLCIPVPLYHCFGMVMGVLASVSKGTTMVFPAPGFDPLATLTAVEAERCTALHGVPTMFIAELEHERFSEFDLSSLRTGIMAGAPCPVEIMNRVMREMGMHNVLIAYGQTELSPVNHMTLKNDTIERRTETVGRAVPWLQVRIVDQEGHTVPVGEKGEILTRGYSVMRGYWNDEERTKETIDAAGWLHSGDLGTMDSDGYVKVVGRISDMIIRGGENIYPREVEEYLYTHPAISEAQVFGIPDEKYGEIVCAWIQIQAGQTLTEGEVRQYCQNNISHFKVPQHVRFVDTFPMTVTGKIQKYQMRERMVALLGASDTMNS